MSNRAIFASIALICSILAAGCSGGEEDATSDSPLRSVRITSNDLEGDTLYLTKGTGVFVGVTGYDADGNPVGEQSVASSEWTAGDKHVIAVYSLEGSTVVDGLQDWFDTVPPAPSSDAPDASAPVEEAHVPETTLTVTVGDLTDSVDVQIVLNAGGSWFVTIDDGTTLPLDLAQNGRTVTHDATGAAGTVEGDQFSLNFAGYSLNGHFLDRDKVEGTLVKPDGEPGTWSAVRSN